MCSPYTLHFHLITFETLFYFSSVKSIPSQILSDVVAKCLRMAEYDGCDSISFPAIGSGVLGFSKKEVAQIMTRAVKEFSSHFRGHSMDVNFVIYPLEEDTFQVFVYITLSSGTMMNAGEM